MCNRQSMTTSTTLDQINQHLQTERFRTERLWQYRNGLFYTEVEGALISESDFNLRFPVFTPLSFKARRECIEERKKWIRA